jgi:hypothetical protein
MEAPSKHTPFQLYARNRRIREEHREVLWIFGDQGAAVLRQSWGRLSEEERRPWVAKARKGKCKAEEDKENMNVNTKKHRIAHQRVRRPFGRVKIQKKTSGSNPCEEANTLVEARALLARARAETAKDIVATVLSAAICAVQLRSKLAAKLASEIAASALSAAKLAATGSKRLAANIEERRTQELQFLRTELSDKNQQLALQAAQLEERQRELHAKEVLIAGMQQDAKASELEMKLLQARMAEQQATLAQLVQESAKALLYGESERSCANATLAAPRTACGSSLTEWLLIPMRAFAGCTSRDDQVAFL